MRRKTFFGALLLVATLGVSYATIIITTSCGKQTYYEPLPGDTEEDLEADKKAIDEYMCDSEQK